MCSKQTNNVNDGVHSLKAKGKPVNPSELILFGIDLSYATSTTQFIVCASGVFVFTMIYGFLQELIQIQIAGRKLSLFLASCQFAGYAFWSFVFSCLKGSTRQSKSQEKRGQDETTRVGSGADETISDCVPSKEPFLLYLFLSTVRALDLGLTNLSMTYLNYPTKTLIKSSRVIFTMAMGFFIGGKKYSRLDCVMAGMLVVGLSIFVHADATSSVVFNSMGVLMLVLSLALDATVSNSSELIMTKYSLGQDEYQMKLFFMSFLIMTFAAFNANEIRPGIDFFFTKSGTMQEVESNIIESDSAGVLWTPKNKIICLLLFSTVGTFGGSCACAITKRFGALAMSITTTTRKAATVFLSFIVFPNACTVQHMVGVCIFMSGLFLKSSAKMSSKKEKEKPCDGCAVEAGDLSQNDISNKLGNHRNFENSALARRMSNLQKSELDSII